MQPVQPDGLCKVCDLTTLSAYAALQPQIQETTLLGQIVLKMRFLVSDFGINLPTLSAYIIRPR
eukprot:1746406-Rhodomonas_salina.2